MSDATHWFGNDLSVAASGDLLSVDDPTMTEQRLVRRLLTQPGSYIWHPEYGAGLAQYIGQPASAKTIEAVIRAQLRLEKSVSASPTPQVIVTENAANGVTVATIVYWNASTGTPRTLSFPVNQSLVPPSG